VVPASDESDIESELESLMNDNVKMEKRFNARLQGGNR
jgi:hypothetical protein